MDLEPPDVPGLAYQLTIEKVERERPIYTVSPEGEVTIRQSWIPGHHHATEEEMFACDDTQEVDSHSNLLYKGTLRPSKKRRSIGSTVLAAVDVRWRPSAL